MTNLKSSTGLNENARILMHSSSKAVIHAPIEKIDIPEWLFTLTDVEYQQCSSAHIGGGSTRTPDGRKRIFDNVVMVGPGLVAQRPVLAAFDARMTLHPCGDQLEVETTGKIEGIFALLGSPGGQKRWLGEPSLFNFDPVSCCVLLAA